MDWKGMRVIIIGAARQGIALARYLAEHGARVVLNDQRSVGQLQDARAALADVEIEWVCGGHPLSLLSGADLLCPSGGVPLTLPVVAEAVRRGIRLSNDSQIFLETAPCQIIGITGSAGKTTTTTLVGRMAQAALAGTDGARRAWVGGNIGSPLISVVDQMRAADLAVMELSSFQTELFTRSPQVAAVLNITPNHLDRHGDMAAYTAAKAHILSHQQAGPFDNAVVLGAGDPGAWALRSLATSPVWAFNFAPQMQGDRPYPGAYLRGAGPATQIVIWDGGSESVVMERNEVSLRGEHNLLNVLAACTIAAAANLPVDAMRQGVLGFGGVAHRLEFVRTWKGAAWYNASISTAPERVMADIRSFDEPLVLLVGGRDKKLPWDDLARLISERVDHVILFGEAAPLIAAALEVHPAGRSFTCQHCKDLHSAILAAAQVASAGDVVLLSPGGTSYDEFRDFEERGEAYRKWVQDLS